MKKQTVYQTMKLGTRVWIVEKKGYLYHIIYPEGAITVGLVFKRPYWTATHYESGLDCTPYSDKGGYEKAWKKKEDLLEAIRNINFHAYLHKAEPYIALVKLYKEASQT